MADTGVAPVEEHQLLAVGPHVAAVEVAVHQRVRDAARRQRGEDRRQLVDEPAGRGSGGVVELVGGAGDDIGGLRHEGVAPPVGRAEGEHLDDAVDPPRLLGDEQPDHRCDLRRRRLVEVVAGDVGEQRPRPLRREHGRTDGDAFEHRPLVGEERWHHLQPHRTAGRRDAPQARQVPGPHLLGRAGPRRAAARQGGVGPRQVGGRSARAGPRLAQRVLDEQPRRHRRETCWRRAGELGEVRHRPAGWAVLLGVEEAHDRDVDAVLPPAPRRRRRRPPATTASPRRTGPARRGPCRRGCTARG